MIEHINILKEIIENLVHTVEVDSVINDVPNNTSTLSVCNTYYMNTLHKITVDGIRYKVLSFKINEELVLQPASSGDPLVDVGITEFDIDSPRWYNGTPRKVTPEKQADSEKPGFKGPFIYLMENFRILPPEDENASLVRSTMQGINIFFIDNVEEANWSTQEHYTNVIYPQNNELDFVYKAFGKRLDIFGELGQPIKTNHPDWGVYLINKGYDGTILTERLSGVQATFDLPFVVDPVTCCQKGPIQICKPVKIDVNGESFDDKPSGSTFMLQVLDPDDNPTGVKESETVWRVGAGLGVIGYNRPPITQQISFRTFDEGWHFINGTDTYVVPANAVMTKIDPIDWYKLVEDTIWSRKYRFANQQGDYYNSDDGNYYLGDGTLATDAIFDNPNYIVDHYTGLAYFRTRTGAMAYVALLNFVAAATIAGESDWWIGFKKQIEVIFDMSLPRPLYGQLITDGPVFDIQLTQTSCTPYASLPTTRHWGISPDGSFIARTNTLADAGHYMRYALP